MRQRPTATLRALSRGPDAASGTVGKTLRAKDLRGLEAEAADQRLFTKEMAQLTSRTEYSNAEGRIFLSQNAVDHTNQDELLQSVSSRQVISYTREKLPPDLYENPTVFKDFLRARSRDHKSIFDLRACGEGGESFVWIGDMPGRNVVIKVPRAQEERDQAMEEAQKLMVLYDWKGCRDFVVRTREELIVCDEETREIIFYAVFYERVRGEMHQSIPAAANT